MISYFFLQLGIGLPACAALVPARLVGKGFFLLNGVIGGFSLAIAYGIGGDTFRAAPASYLFWITTLSLAAFLALQFTRFRSTGLLVLTPVLVAGGILLVKLSLHYRAAFEAGTPPLLLGADALLGALLLGSVLAAMNLGHWYLVTPGLPISILKRLTLMFAASLTGRILLMGVVGYLVWRGQMPIPEQFLLANGIFLAQRILFGFAVPILLAVMIWKTVVIRSTQSATGILYVAVFFILMGELVSRHLRFLSGIPF